MTGKSGIAKKTDYSGKKTKQTIFTTNNTKNDRICILFCRFYFNMTLKCNG